MSAPKRETWVFEYQVFGQVCGIGLAVTWITGWKKQRRCSRLSIWGCLIQECTTHCPSIYIHLKNRPRVVEVD